MLGCMSNRSSAVHIAASRGDCYALLDERGRGHENMCCQAASRVQQLNSTQATLVITNAQSRVFKHSV